MANYDTDLSDQQWFLIAPMIPRPKPGGRPRTTSERRVVEACLYLVKTGCHWRLLPSDFPPWRTVYGYFAEWGAAGVFKRIQRELYLMTRRLAGRSPAPSILIVDSQSVKTGKMGGERGYDGGKRVKGRKRHIAVDSLGLPVGITVTAANVHDTRGGTTVLRQAGRFLRRSSLRKVYADGTYDGRPFRDWVRSKFRATVEVAVNLAQRFKEFVPVSQRWVVERTFSWLYDCRRLTIDYERTIRHSRFMIRLAAIRLMLNRIEPVFFGVTAF